MDFTTILITLLPYIELRGAIPIAVAKLEFYAIPIIMVINLLIFFPVYFLLEFFYQKYLYRYKFIRKKLDSIRKRGKPYIDKWGMFGLAVFIGIPLPGSGVYTGAILAWLLGLDWKKSFLAAIVGVFIAATIVSLLSFGVLKGISFIR